METKAEIFKSLKERFQTPQTKSWSFDSQNLLVPQGSMVEVVGKARFEFAIKFLCEQSDLMVACVESEWTLFPPAVAQRGVDITSWLLVEAGERAVWAVEELLHSHFFSVILAPDLRLSQPLWRRLHLECQRSGTSLMILSEESHEQVGSLFVIEAELNQGKLQSQWQRCRQLLQTGSL
ncbi:MAG: hypothetical protein RJB66_1547 [Pseudomonadota bacterium]|jgi:hypothetical protein